MKESVSDRYARLFSSQPVKLFLGDEELCRNILACRNDDTPLVESFRVRMSIQSVRFTLSVLVGMNSVEIVFQDVY